MTRVMAVGKCVKGKVIITKVAIRPRGYYKYMKEQARKKCTSYSRSRLADNTTLNKRSDILRG